ncbi:MAG: hypothetical protein J6O51_01530 [Bacteroidales bacterium]|nr:hypothetical protein [Bacteroidales bacterium]
MKKFVKHLLIIAVALFSCSYSCHRYEAPVPVMVSNLAGQWLTSAGDCIYRAQDLGFPSESYSDTSGFIVTCTPAGEGKWTVSGERTVKKNLDKGYLHLNTAYMTTRFSAVVGNAELLGEKAFCANPFTLDYSENNDLSMHIVNDGQVNYPGPGKPDGRFFLSVRDGGVEFERYEIVLEGGRVIYENVDISH